MRSGSTAGQLTLGMEKKNVVRVTGKIDPSEKWLMHSLLLHHYFVGSCYESLGSDLGENMGSGTGDLGELRSVHAYR